MISYPLISIIIPVYNVENWIKDSLNSALEQTYPNIEYVIIDDCGNDNSIKIVEEIIKCNHKKNISLIRHSINKGLSEARNTGLKAARGEYVFFMDSDDQITNNCIEKHFMAIKINNADFTDANVDIVGKGHNNFSQYMRQEYIEKDILIQYFINIHICGWNKLIKRKFLLDNNIYFRKGMLYEDILWTYQLCKAAKKYVTVPFNTYLYQIRPGSITTQNKNRAHAFNQFNSFIELLECMNSEFSVPSNNTLRRLQSKWINKILFIIKTRLLDAPFEKSEKMALFNQMNYFAKTTDFTLYLINNIPFTFFKILFYFPNKVFRKFR